MAKTPKLLLFPGLGLDMRSYAPQRLLPAQLEAVDWIEPESQEETLSHYARRLASRLGRRPGTWIGGVSLGAMVALEAAESLGACGVIMIGGCRSHREIAPLFRAILAAGAKLPEAWIRPTLGLAPLALRLFERLTPDHRRLMIRMLNDSPPSRLRWSCRAILEWECSALPAGIPVCSIHGQRDEVIPLKNVLADCIVPGGRHLINLANADAVNAFIDSCLFSEVIPVSAGQ